MIDYTALRAKCYLIYDNIWTDPCLSFAELKVDFVVIISGSCWGVVLTKMSRVLPVLCSGVKSDSTSLFPLAPALFTCQGLKKHINQILICPEPSEVQLQGRRQVLLTMGLWQVFVGVGRTCVCLP